MVDGFVAMEGKGPTEGTPVNMDLIVAGTDPVATDATCTRIMGLNPTDVSHIRGAHHKAIGDMDDVEVLGENIETIRRVFKTK